MEHRAINVEKDGNSFWIVYHESQFSNGTHKFEILSNWLMFYQLAQPHNFVVKIGYLDFKEVEELLNEQTIDMEDYSEVKKSIEYFLDFPNEFKFSISDSLEGIKAIEAFNILWRF